MKYLIFLLIIFSLPISAQVAENNPSKVWVIVNYIKDNAKADYEKWMTDIFFKPMNKTKDPLLAQLNASTRWLSPAQQNSDKTWTYVFLMDPVIPNANYDIESYLQSTYGEAQGKVYMTQYQSFIASAPQIHVLKNDRVESNQSNEQAIKKVIIDESTAWADRDTTAYFTAWANNELTQGAYNNRNLSIGVYHGFAAIQESVRDGMKNSPAKFYKPEIERTDWIIKLLSPEWAWVNFTQKTGNIRGQVNISYETRLMHKEGGNWRINVVNALWDYKNVVNPMQNPDEEDIKKLIVNETEMWLDQKHDAWAESFIHEPYLTWSATNSGEPGDVLTMRGWEALNEYMNAWFKNDMSALTKEWRKAKTTRDQWQIQIRGNVAYVSYNQHSENDEKKTKSDSTETRVLEKINGKWKITMQTTLADFKDATPPIRSKY
jgi:hypothetical protein